MKRNWPGILTSVLTGLAIGYLTAPESGKKSRKKLGDAVEERTGGFMQEIKDQWNKTVARAEELLTNVKDEAGIFAHKAQDTVGTSKKEMTSLYPKADVKERNNDKVDEVAVGVKLDINQAKEALTVT